MEVLSLSDLFKNFWYHS